MKLQVDVDSELVRHQKRLVIADKFAERSPDPSSKIGAILYNRLGLSAGHGWNSFPNQMVVDAAYYLDRTLKYDRVIHAEMRCLLMAGNDSVGGRLYTGCPPCKDCAKHIAEERVTEVYFWESRMNHPFVQRNAANVHVAMQIFAECGIRVIQIPDVLPGTEL